MTTTINPPETTSTPDVRQIDDQLDQLDAALASGAHGWAEMFQDSRRELLIEKADVLGQLGRDAERVSLLRELALGA